MSDRAKTVGLLLFVGGCVVVSIGIKLLKAAMLIEFVRRLSGH